MNIKFSFEEIEFVIKLPPPKKLKIKTKQKKSSGCFSFLESDHDFQCFSRNLWWGGLAFGDNFQSSSGTESDGELVSGTRVRDSQMKGDLEKLSVNFRVFWFLLATHGAWSCLCGKWLNQTMNLAENLSLRSQTA